MKKTEKIKIAMLGNAGVGKTCMINRYLNNKFEMFESTKSASYRSHSIFSLNEEYEIQQLIWDTAGQETYKSLATFYFKGADALILVYDITNLKSFTDLSYWIDEIKKFGLENILITVVGNKSDLSDQEAVSIEKVIDFCKINNASFFISSAKDNVNITEIYMDVTMRKFHEISAAFGYPRYKTKHKQFINVIKHHESVYLSKTIEKKHNYC